MCHKWKSPIKAALRRRKLADDLILENGELYINTTERQVGVEQVRSSVAGENQV